MAFGARHSAQGKGFCVFKILIDDLRLPSA